MRLTYVLPMVATMVLANAGVAIADDPPRCPSDSESVDTYTPSFLRVGRSYALEMESADDPKAITDATVQVGYVVTPITLDSGGNAKLIFAGPRSRRPVTITFSWTQDLGTSFACSGEDSYELTVIPARAKAGRVGIDRYSGRYRVKYVGKAKPATWSLRPTCDFFGCTSVLRSTAGAHGSLRPRGTKHFRYERREGAGGLCTVRNVLTGELTTIKPAFVTFTALQIGATRRAHGIVTRFRGFGTYTYSPTSRAETYNCAGWVEKVRFVGRRL